MAEISNPDLFEGLPKDFEPAVRKAVAEILAPSADREFRPVDLGNRSREAREFLVAFFRLPEAKVRECLDAVLMQQEDLNPPPSGDFRSRELHDWILQQTS